MFQNFLLEKMMLPLGDLALGTSFMQKLQYYRKVVGHMDAAALKSLQASHLNALLQHAVTTIPYYQKQSIKLTGNPFEDIKDFPIMHKKLMKENLGMLLLYDKNKMVVEKSSGSSGLQGEIYMTKRENSYYQAAQTFQWEQGGYKLGKSMLQTGMTTKRGLVKGLKDYLLNVQYVNAYDLNEQKVVADLTTAAKNKTKIFGGYASSLNEYAKVAIAENMDIQFETVLAWGDKLFDHYKQNIQKAFKNPRVTELYGTTEGFVISSTCAFGKHHMLTPQTYVELLDVNGQEVAPGELGHVVVTKLDAFSFPLIRFYLGDLAIKEDPVAICGCGSAFPMLQKIIGRDTDIVHTPSGKPLIVHFFTGIMEHFESIKQFKVIQTAPDGISIEYIADKYFDTTILAQIEKTMHAKANEVFPIAFKQVQFIAPTPSGKPQIVQNLIVKKLA